MESQDKEKEYEHSIWEIYRKEWETASPEKKAELNKRMRRWQELMKNGLLASEAYYKAMEEDLKREVIEVVSPESTHRSRWSWMFKATSAVLALVVVVAVIYGVVITKDRNALNTELESVQSKLTSVQADLSSTKQTLGSTQLELGSTKETLASTQSDLSSTKQTLGSTQQQLAVAQETLGGLEITLSTSKECSDVALIDNPTATDPTWSQLMTFLSRDQTEKHTYIKDVYDCSQFSRDVHNNAEARGIRAAEVHVEFRNELVGHALNAFLTTDYGLVYVDCTKEPDTIARVRTGKEYRAVDVDLYRITKTNIRNDYWWDTLSSDYYYFRSSFSPPWSTRGQVTSSIEIYW